MTAHRVSQRLRQAFVVSSLLCSTVTFAAAARALEADSVLGRLHHHRLLSTTVPANGDQNPYAIVVAPVSAGTIHKNDVLVGNFNDGKNLQGLGTTIVNYHPDRGSLTTFATLPRHLPATGPQCPGGVGLTTAMTMLSSGYVVVGSLPSEDGTTATKGDGCLLVLDSNGKLVRTITGPLINGPWGNMAWREHPGGATHVRQQHWICRRWPGCLPTSGKQSYRFCGLSWLMPRENLRGSRLRPSSPTAGENKPTRACS